MPALHSGDVIHTSTGKAIGDCMRTNKRAIKMSPRDIGNSSRSVHMHTHAQACFCHEQGWRTSSADNKEPVNRSLSSPVVLLTTSAF